MCAAAFHCKIREMLKKNPAFKSNIFILRKATRETRQSTRNNSGGKKSRFGLNWARARHGEKSITPTSASLVSARGQIGKWTRGCRR